MRGTHFYLKTVNFARLHAQALFWFSFLGTNVALFTPSIGPKGEFYNFDILIHYGIFLFLTLTSLLYFCNIFLDRERYYKNRMAVVLLALALFIPLSEFIQENFIPGRGYEFTDILSGFAGMLSGSLAFMRFRRYN